MLILSAAASAVASVGSGEAALGETVGCRPMVEPYLPPPPVQFAWVGSKQRRLAYSEYGAGRGPAIFYFHGFPSCRYEAQTVHWSAKRLKCRIIAPDRPGIGRSDADACRTIASWPDDVAALAGALGLREYSIIGVSTGAPYAVACLLRAANYGTYMGPRTAQLRSAALVSGLAPPNASGVERGLGDRMLARVSQLPRLAALQFRRVERQMCRHPTRTVAKQTGGMSAADRQLASHPTTQRVLAEVYLEAVRLGVQGLIQDANLASRPWRLPLQRLNCVTVPVYLWYGCCDRNVTISAMQHYQRLLPLAEQQVRRVAEGGHLTVATYCAERILGDLLA